MILLFYTAPKSPPHMRRGLVGRWSLFKIAITKFIK